MATSPRRRRAKQSQNTNERHNSGMPSRDVRYLDRRFREPGNSKLMSVDGSSTPVDFSLGPGSGELWIVDYLTLLLIDSGNMDPGVFGGTVAALTNGLEVIESINSVESIYTTIEDNADIAQCFFGGVPAPGSVAGADPGFLNNVDKGIGRMPFGYPITLDGDEGDKLIIRVNDNLIGIDYLAASAHLKVKR